MKFIDRILNLASKWFGEEATMSKGERFIVDIISTGAFSKLTLQDKVLSLGKLINIFRLDHGYTPKSLERTLDSLTHKLNREAKNTWDQLYSTDITDVYKIK